MGMVEQIRMATPLGGTVDTLAFRPDPAIERTLRADVARAERNLARYLVRAEVVASSTKDGRDA
jgi:hypothetical protein